MRGAAAGSRLAAASRGAAAMADGDRSTRPKQRGTRIVPSRYLEYEKKTSEKDTSAALLGSPKGLGKATSPKSPFASSLKYKSSTEYTCSTLQSTLLDTNSDSRPELEVSVIKDKRHDQTTVWMLDKDTSRTNLTMVPPDANYLIEMLDSQTLLLNYASMEMEKTLALLEEKAERSLSFLFEEAKGLQEEIHGNRQRLQRLNDGKISQMLDIQLEALSPVAELCAHFEKEYRTFATTLDLTRHKLPMKALTMGKTNALDLVLHRALAKSLSLLLYILQPHSRGNIRALPLLKKLNEASQKLDEELPRSFAQVVQLSAEASKEFTLHCQQANEDSLGMETMKRLYLK